MRTPISPKSAFSHCTQTAFLGLLILFLSKACLSVDILNDQNLINPRHEFMKTVKAPYFFASDNSTMPFYNVYGDAQVTNTGVVLTPEASGKMGAIWSKTPSNLKEWAAVMSVKISGSNPVMGSEGLAFWYAEDPGKLGPIFGSKDRWNGFGLFFDSHDNDKKKDNPAILAVYNSANYDYPFNEDGMHHTFARCFREYRNSFMPFLVKVIYTNRTLTVEVDPQGYGFDFETCFSYSPIYLNPNFHFGVSAMTGAIPDRHELISLDIYELNTAYDTSQADKYYKSLDGKTLKSHDEFQHRLHDMIHHREADEMKSQQVNMKFLEKMIRNIEETQMDMLDKFDTHFFNRTDTGATKNSNSALSADISRLDSRLSSLERQLGQVSQSLNNILDTMTRMAGHQSGSKTLIDQMAQLNEQAHHKLNFLEESSKITSEKTEQLHASLREKNASHFWWYLMLMVLQVIIVLWLAIHWKSSSASHSNGYDKKFI